MMAAKHCEEKMKYLHKGINDLIDHVLHMGPASEQTKVQEFESFIGVKIISEINIHPPAIAHTKGNGKRLGKAQRRQQVRKKRRGLQAARREKRTRLHPSLPRKIYVASSG
uniref:Uncharacterized protein n=1 Tax=Avena sativa TaxID=4498 RepID=A0ACD5YB56_AVESA